MTKHSTVPNNLYLRKLLDFKFYLDMKPSGTMIYLTNISQGDPEVGVGERLAVTFHPNDPNTRI